MRLAACLVGGLLLSGCGFFSSLNDSTKDGGFIQDAADPVAGFVGTWLWTSGIMTTDCGTPQVQSPTQQALTIERSGSSKTNFVVSSASHDCAETYVASGFEATLEPGSSCMTGPVMSWTINKMTLASDGRSIRWERDGSFVTTANCRSVGTITLTRGSTSTPSGTGQLTATFSNISGAAQTQGDTFETNNVRCWRSEISGDINIMADEDPLAQSGRTVEVDVWGSSGPVAVGRHYEFGTSLDHPGTARFVDRRSFGGVTEMRLWDTRSLYLEGPRGSAIFDSLDSNSATFRAVEAVMARTEEPATGTFVMNVTGRCDRIDAL